MPIDQPPEGKDPQPEDQASACREGEGEANLVLATLRTALEARETALEDLSTALKTNHINLKTFKSELAAHYAELEDVVADLEALLRQETDGAGRARLGVTLGAALEIFETVVVLAFHQETDPARRVELEARHRGLETRRRELASSFGRISEDDWKIDIF